MKVAHRDIPLSEITLRRYEKPIGLSKRELVKRVCLSLGVLQPGDSRDVIVDILYAILSNKGLKAEEVTDTVKELRIKSNLPMVGIAHSNIRRQIRRLKEIRVVEKQFQRYVIPDKVSTIFKQNIIESHLRQTTGRIAEYLMLLDQEFEL